MCILWLSMHKVFCILSKFIIRRALHHKWLLRVQARLMWHSSTYCGELWFVSTMTPAHSTCLYTRLWLCCGIVLADNWLCLWVVVVDQKSTETCWCCFTMCTVVPTEQASVCANRCSTSLYNIIYTVAHLCLYTCIAHDGIWFHNPLTASIVVGSYPPVSFMNMLNLLTYRCVW